MDISKNKIITFIVIIIIIYFFRDIRNYILFNREHYNDITTKLVKDKKEYSSEISLYFFQTFKDKKKIPQEVYDNIKTYAPEYKHIIFDDKDRDTNKINSKEADKKVKILIHSSIK
jgi:hypothetical protein